MTDPIISQIFLTSIKISNRAREDYGDIEDLKENLKIHGQIQSIAVMERVDSLGMFMQDFNYKLLAGGRRIQAAHELGWETLTARIYPSMSLKEQKSIELSENVSRKDMSWIERIKLTEEIHNLNIDIHGESQSKRDVDGWTMKKTAELIGRSATATQEDIRLAKAMEENPELKNCNTKHEAQNLEAKLMEEATVRSKEDLL